MVLDELNDQGYRDLSSNMRIDKKIINFRKIQNLNYKQMKKYLCYLVLTIALFFQNVNAQSHGKTKVTIEKNQFYINGELTYKGRFWQDNKIEGLLFNSRMVQGIFDDLNPKTRDRFKYPDTKEWDADRNTKEFVDAMEDWNAHGLLAFTLNLQGGSPMGYGNEGWINSTFDEKGELLQAYMNRLERILNKADELEMVVILGYFYFGQDQYLDDEKAVINAVDNITNWILDKGYKNILVEVTNECDIYYDHEILKPNRIHELIQRVQATKKDGYSLLTSTSYSGGFLPLPNVVQVADFILLHGNSLEDPEKITDLVNKVKQVEGYTEMPILFNEDDHFDFDANRYNFLSAIESYTSWGYFDFRMKDESFEDGFQSIPADWRISSERKKAFFSKLKEITGY